MQSQLEHIAMIGFFFLWVIYITAVVTADGAQTYMDVGARTFSGNDLTHIKKAPHQISVHYRGRHVCGGTIIAKDWVITAARCVRGPQSCYTIRAGSIHHDEGGTVHTAEKIMIHEHFNIEPNGFAVNDIALIHITVPFTIDSTRKFIPLADFNGVILPGTHIIMYGWGHFTTNTQSILKIVKSKALDKMMCNTTYEKYGGIYDHQGCAGDIHGKTSLYMNDAGGPIVYRTHLFGILSWTDGCGNKKYPIVFTEVAAHRFWIQRHTGMKSI